MGGKLQTSRCKLNELSYEYILFSFDDLVLLNINAEKLLNVFDCMKVNNLNYVQIKNGYRSFFDNYTYFW